MKISEFIERLEEIKQDFGDLQVGVFINTENHEIDYICNPTIHDDMLTIYDFYDTGF